MNTASETRLSKVHPVLAARVRTLAERLLAEGIQIEVVQGLRTYAEQDALFAQGRTRPGQVVTKARGGQSNHNFAMAVDVVPFVAGKPNWNAPNTQWTTIGRHAVALGLEWGGNWTRFQDRPHIQLPGLSTAQCRALYAQGGLKAVFAAMDKILAGGK